MKRYIFVLVGILALILSACSGGESADGSFQSADDLIKGLQAPGLDASKGEKLETFQKVRLHRNAEG